MTRRNRGYSRRDFFKAAGAASVGSILASTEGAADDTLKAQSAQKVPTRSFGSSGEQVPILSLGGAMDLVSNQLLLRQAVKMGVTYWDTANYYSSTSEIGIGKYFQRYPQDRDKIFLATKSTLTDPQGWDYHLGKSLERMQTTHIDFYMVHMVSSLQKLQPFDKARAWVDKQKAAGKIRHFGFSSHENMEACMTEGAKLGWIDAMLVTYNYRIMHTDKMRKALAACQHAGIGITAMKTQAAASLGDTGFDTDAALQITDKFLKKGYTPEQAKLKAVWDNPYIASICSKMPNLTILKANVDAALDQTALTDTEKHLLKRYAAATKSSYCTGCSNICQSAVDAEVPVADLMRYLMYNRAYGDYRLARNHFRRIPADIRHGMTRVDYSEAERRCPQNLRIGALIRDAVEELA